MLFQSGSWVDVEHSVFPPTTHFVFGVLWMEMTTSTWMLVSGELCAASGNEFVLAFPLDQVRALKRERLTGELSVGALFRKDGF
ncbi:hypothetical protein CDAR_1081 [Caerostris darwini]|uniref:Uncharacterized protein n=1 Tax=Caerostris darwini TaxID=1538125 RepID=A0AAV4SMG7_9ARAC|nr:hypothetical protein CDAR_891 [Caerostris darwini]GIY35303.1 hypothetical protein CDAR_1081 [Caerostris darwini]